MMVGTEQKHVLSYMKDFLFLTEQARTPIKVLSGGERARLLLAKFFAKPSNFLIFDEPTNDLDLETLDLLQEKLNAFQGTIFLISHDRDFIDRVATRVLAHEGNGTFVEYAGGYQDMLMQRKLAAPSKNVRHKQKNRSASEDERGAAPLTKAKLSFKQTHLLETLPKKIEALEKTFAQAQEAIAAPDLYTSNPKRFQALTDLMEKTQQELSESEDQWLELEALRESLTESRAS
jgi:ABC transport system ATP-binding/permease protein